ncbi:MAG: hypothetical protein NTY30_02220 [Candidatus Berkelbacteria bacterium]|nr:hypothetical protein [Candidatus Berkelbacteria bacterium]
MEKNNEKKLEKMIGKLGNQMARGFADAEKSVDKKIADLAASTAKGFEHVEKRFGKVESRLGGVDVRFDGVEDRLTNLEIGQTNLSEDMKEVKQRQIITDKKIDKIYEMVDSQTGFHQKWELENAANLHAHIRFDGEIDKIKKKIKIA